MNIPEAIARHALQVQEGDNWTAVNLAATLADVTLTEAVTITPGSPNTIAALVRHLTYWNRVMVRRAQHQFTETGPDNGFNDGPPLHTEADWQALLDDLGRSTHALAAAIRAVPAAELEAPILPGYSSAYKNLQGTVEHLHYHLGQLVILKNLVRAPAVKAA